MAATHASTARASSAKPKTGSIVIRKTTREQSRPADAIKLLKQDHKQVDDIFKLY